MRPIVLSGCSGGGKTTLLNALAELGFATVPEPGLRIVRSATSESDPRLPWIDPAKFAQAAIDLALQDLQQITGGQAPVFVDRGLVDAVLGYCHATGDDAPMTLLDQHRYHDTVFLVPPWPDLFQTGPDRQHGLDDAIAEYDRLSAGYPALGYKVDVLPKVSVADRVALVLSRLGLA